MAGNRAFAKAVACRHLAGGRNDRYRSWSRVRLSFLSRLNDVEILIRPVRSVLLYASVIGIADYKFRRFSPESETLARIFNSRCQKDPAPAESR
jgi:hypothetical protein